MQIIWKFKLIQKNFHITIYGSTLRGVRATLCMIVINVHNKGIVHSPQIIYMSMCAHYEYRTHKPNHALPLNHFFSCNRDRAHYLH